MASISGMNENASQMLAEVDMDSFAGWCRGSFDSDTVTVMVSK